VSWGVLTVVWKDWVEENELGCYNVASDWQKEAGTWRMWRWMWPLLTITFMKSMEKRLSVVIYRQHQAWDLLSGHACSFHLNYSVQKRVLYTHKVVPT